MRFLLTLTQALAGVLLTTTTATPDNIVVTGISSVAEMITEFGILVVIAAIMITITWKMTNNTIKRDNKLFDEMVPKMASLQTDLANNVRLLESVMKDMDRNITTAVSNHNAHSNQSHRSMEKDMEDIRETLIQNQVILRDVSSQLTAINSGIEIIYKLLIHSAHGGNHNGDIHQHSDNENQNNL